MFSDSVWDHMARMCVKTRRIDVALVCLGHMRNARAVHAVRECMKRGEPLELQAATLAIELDMLVSEMIMVLGVWLTFRSR